MARYPLARRGRYLEIRRRPIPFSFWPTYRGARRYGLQSTLFVLDPWIAIRESIKKRCPETALTEALACLDQSEDFFRSASSSSILAAQPLQLYYSFLNVVKAYCLTVGLRPSYERAQHGLAERLTAGGSEYVDAYLEAYPSPAGGMANMFDEFHMALAGRRLARRSVFHLPHLLPQVLSGHRMWADAAGQTERFISVSEIHFEYDPASREIWVRTIFRPDDLSRLGVGHGQLVLQSGLSPNFRLVRDAQIPGAFVEAEQVTPVAYTGRPSDRLSDVASALKEQLWMTVGSAPPYRRYYVYLSPPAETCCRMHQLLSIYAISYYLGSITRYRPQDFRRILEGPFGARFEEFVTGQPMQFLYLLASLFAQKEITKPSIV